LIGQILAAQGNRSEAIKSFEQALKLDSADTNALARLKALRETAPPATPDPKQ
jgi:predicted negative regulator of RcsB-dependent stress response